MVRNADITDTAAVWPGDRATRGRSAAGTHVLCVGPDYGESTMPSSNGPRESTRNKLRNNPRERGTSPPQQSVESYESGERVHLDLDPSVQDGQFHPRFNGRTGTVVGEQGNAFRVEIVDGDVTKTVIAAPAHLQRQEA
jgi:large subunit ribosomal protein L21e